MKIIDFRALLSHIAEQLTSATDPDDLGIRASQLVEQIGAALDQPPVAGPTEDDFRAYWREHAHPGTAPSPSLKQTAMEWAAFCLARWGRPADLVVPGWLREWDSPLRISPRADRIRPAIFNEGPIQRGNGNGGPSTPKPAIVPRPQGSSPRSADSSPRSDATAPLARCPGEGHWEGPEFHWREGCDDCCRRTAAEGPVTVRPPRIITFECHYRIEP